MTKIGIDGQILAEFEVGTTLYVDPVAGDDSGAGTIGDPLATIQEAVNRFKPAHLPPQNWLEDEDRTINVISTGAATFREALVIPAHIGDGALIIRGEETVHEAGLILAGTPFTAIPGFKVRRTLNFTTTPLTPSDPLLMDAAFAVPSDAELATLNYSWKEATEVYPIVDNGDGYVEVASSDLFGDLSVAAATFDIVSPRHTWMQPLSPTPSASFGDPRAFPLIYNMGGPLIVKGFIFDGEAASTNSRSIIMSAANTGDQSFAGATVLTRSIIRATGFFSWVSIARGVGDITLGGLLCDNAGVLFFDGRGLGANIRWFNNSLFGLTKCSCATLEGLDIDITGAFINTGIDQTDLLSCAMDIRGGRLRITHTRGNIRYLSVEGAGSDPALDLEHYCQIVATSPADIIGSTGNTDLGMTIQEGSQFTTKGSPGSVTLTGSAGDRKVGSNSIDTWSAGAESDIIALCRVG